jgi:hypothetical protein
MIPTRFRRLLKANDPGLESLIIRLMHHAGYQHLYTSSTEIRPSGTSREPKDFEHVTQYLFAAQDRALLVALRLEEFRLASEAKHSNRLYCSWEILIIAEFSRPFGPPLDAVLVDDELVQFSYYPGKILRWRAGSLSSERLLSVPVVVRLPMNVRQAWQEVLRQRFSSQYSSPIGDIVPHRQPPADFWREFPEAALSPWFAGSSFIRP